MKKLIALMAVAAMAACAEAATTAQYYFNNGDNNNAVYSGNKPIAGGTVYVFLYNNASTSGSGLAAQIVDAFKKTGNSNLDELLDYGALGVVTGAKGLAANTGRFGTQDGWSSPHLSVSYTDQTATFAFVVTAAENVGGNVGEFAIGQLEIGSGQNPVYYSELTSSPILRAKSLNAAGASGWTTAAPVPEPTSGLLMLLGVAGLALKRKRA